MMLFIFLIFSFVIFILFFLFPYLAAFIPLLPFFLKFHSPVLLLKLPQLRVDVKGAPEVTLPLLVPVLW